MQPSLYAIPVKARGSLFLMPKPSGEWLSDDLGKLRSQGVDTLVSMLTPEESAAVGLLDEAAQCGELGLDFLALPVLDRCVPDTEAQRTFIETFPL